MLDPADISVSETLRGGQHVEIRAQRPVDRKDLEATLGRMSDESVYRRFFGTKRHFSEKKAEYFSDIDFVSHLAPVAVAQENRKQAIVGVGRYVVVQPGQAEVAFRIVDRRSIPGPTARRRAYA
jgi:hypothetical protein